MVIGIANRAEPQFDLNRKPVGARGRKREGERHLPRVTDDGRIGPSGGVGNGNFDDQSPSNRVGVG
jgi:hypothetical protein